MNGITPADMQKLQTENYNVCRICLPILLKNTDESKLSSEEKVFGHKKLE
jgi:hypothetical protein